VCRSRSARCPASHSPCLVELTAVMFMIFSKGSRTFVLRWKGLTTGTEQQRVVGCLLGFGHDAKEGRSRRPHRRTRRRRVAWPSAVDQRCRLSKEVRGLPATCSQHGEGALHPLAASRHRAVGATPREVAESGPSARPAMASTPSPGWVRARPLLRSPPSHPDLLLCSAPVRTGRLALDPRHPRLPRVGGAARQGAVPLPVAAAYARPR
jgi:hypothetical protein